MKNLTLRNLTEVCNGIWHGDDALLDREILQLPQTAVRLRRTVCLYQSWESALMHIVLSRMSWRKVHL